MKYLEKGLAPALILLIVIAGGCADQAVRQPSPAAQHDAALRVPPMQIYPPPAPKTEGSLFSDSAHTDLFTDVRARDLGDIVTINIVESSKASKNSQTELSRNNGVKAGITALLGYETEIPHNKASFDPSTMISANYSSAFKGAGTTTRDESMTAQISARVVQILPNGNLVVRGSREIAVNHEKQYMIIQGVVRPEDISPDNTVLSSYIADARIEYTGRGDLSRQQRQGWLSRLIDVIWPF